MALMCQGRVEFEAISLAHLIDFRKTFATELQALEPLQANGLVLIEPDAVTVTPLGWYFVRSIAMVFDRHLRADRARDHFSRVI
jgi:oxygen-independent coproporphyrinogen-3 oxidase